MVGVAVVWRHEGSTPFLHRCCHALKGVGPSGVGSKEPDLRFGVITAFWFDHWANIKDAEPAILAESREPGTVGVIAPIARKIDLGVRGCLKTR